METLWETISEWLAKMSRLPSIKYTDIVEIVSVSVLRYEVMVWL